MDLFKVCPCCTTDKCSQVTRMKGTVVYVNQSCENCGFTRSWCNQPYIGHMPAANLLLSAVILFSGCVQSKIIRMLNMLELAVYHRSTFFRHQQRYLFPLVFKTWKLEQQRLMKELKSMKVKLILAADGRSDSPGHSAKFGTYTTIEEHVNKVIDLEIVQVHIFIYCRYHKFISYYLGKKS